MKRMILVLTLAAMMLAAMVVGAGLPAALAQEAPDAPQCGWYYSTDPDYEPWWEYWCWWPGWGWEYVFWVWDDVPEEDPAPPDEEEEGNWPWPFPA